MTRRLFEAPEREPSQFVGFAGNRLDRQSEKRGDDCALLALDHPGVRILVVSNGRVHLRLDGAAPSSLHRRMTGAALVSGNEDAILLGFDADGPIVAIESLLENEIDDERFKAIDYRSVYMQGLVAPEELGALAQASALVAWHRSHRFCGRCGAATEMRAGGYKRVCTACKAEHFPRTDPVAIMLAVTPDKCLLGRSPHFPPGMYSALAGFIEPGETIENAVRRETLEESGIQVGRVVYHASQPWPFPYSLMIGCYGEALTDALTPDFAELEDCRWFDRDEVLRIIGRSHPDGIVIPPKGAIASHLIRGWADED